MGLAGEFYTFLSRWAQSHLSILHQCDCCSGRSSAIGYCAHSLTKKKKKLFSSPQPRLCLFSPSTASADFQIFSSPRLPALSPFLPCMNKELYLSKPDQDSISRRLFGLRSTIFQRTAAYRAGPYVSADHDRLLYLHRGMPRPHGNPSHTHPSTLTAYEIKLVSCCK